MTTVGDRDQLRRGSGDWSPWILVILWTGLLSLSTTGCIEAQQLDAREVYENAASSVMVVIAYDEHRQPKALGSAFAVDDGGVMATNFHVIDGASSIEVKRASQESTESITGVYAVSPEHDLALLKVPYQVTPLQLAEARPTVGERVVAIGNPRGLESTLSDGIVSGIRQIEESFELYQISAPISPGSSGGPVLNARGNVIGVATGTIRAGQNLNFAVLAPLVVSLNERRGELAGLAETVSEPTTTSPLWAEDAEQDLVRAVDLRFGASLRDKVLNGSLYNGAQYDIKNVRVRLICYREDVDVPIDFSEATLGRTILGDADPIPPGLSEPFTIECSSRATDYEFRILDYEIVR